MYFRAMDQFFVGLFTSNNTGYSLFVLYRYTCLHIVHIILHLFIPISLFYFSSSILLFNNTVFFFHFFDCYSSYFFFFFFQAEDGIRDWSVTGVQTCALPISSA